MRLTDEQYMEMARMARKHADCKKSNVGAALVLPNGVVLLGANGSPTGHPKCIDGGCYRCDHPEAFPPGTGYDVCTCVHAEEACLALAARHGISIEGATVYSTMRPCRECSKQMLQAGIVAAYYEENLLPKSAGELVAYFQLQSAFTGGVHQLVLVPSTLPSARLGAAEIRVEVPLK